MWDHHIRPRKIPHPRCKGMERPSLFVMCDSKSKDLYYGKNQKLWEMGSFEMTPHHGFSFSLVLWLNVVEREELRVENSCSNHLWMEKMMKRQVMKLDL